MGINFCGIRSTRTCNVVMTRHDKFNKACAMLKLSSRNIRRVNLQSDIPSLRTSVLRKYFSRQEIIMTCRYMFCDLELTNHICLGAMLSAVFIYRMKAMQDKYCIATIVTLFKAFTEEKQPHQCIVEAYPMQLPPKPYKLQVHKVTRMKRSKTIATQCSGMKTQQQNNNDEKDKVARGRGKRT